jgi:phage head maturation protease
MSTTFTPRGWSPGRIEHRFAGGVPESYNAGDHTAEAVISAGASVDRIYGREVLEISRAAIDLSRLPVPLLDSHNQTSIDNVLGTIESAWIAGGKLHGKIRFAQTPRGRLAEGMVARGELSGISAGYRVTEWAVTDADGDVVDEAGANWADDLTFTAKRWELYEASLTGIPADKASAIRSQSNTGTTARDAKARMMARERMHQRQRMMEAQARFGRGNTN